MIISAEESAHLGKFHAKNGMTDFTISISFIKSALQAKRGRATPREEDEWMAANTTGFMHVTLLELGG